jgi:DNA-binding NtrC family response regulator
MKPRILIIDDEPASLMAFAEGLRDRLDAVEIDLAKSAEAALSLIPPLQYDVIVCDLVLPGMDGVGLLHSARRRWPEAVVVLVTGRDLNAKERALAHGAFAFVTKPIQLDEFVKVIALALQRANLMARVREANRTSVQEMEEDPRAEGRKRR